VHAHDARDMVIKSLTGGDDVNGALRCAAHGAITLETSQRQGILQLVVAWPDQSPARHFYLGWRGLVS
jgi:hypothetical protein